MKIKAMPIDQLSNIRLFLTVMKAKDLVERAKVDFYDPETNRGYQRELSKQRIRDFSRYVREKSFRISPISVLISIRGRNPQYNDGVLELPEDTDWWIVDGQHRINGLKDAILRDATIGDYEVPVVIAFFKDLYEEALQFLIINRTQKPVRTDLAERVLAEAIRRKEGKLYEFIEVRERGIAKRLLGGVEWKVDAIRICDYLRSSQHSVWFNRIKKPNEKSKEATISQKSFTDSLEPILKDPNLSTIKTKLLQRAIENYWNAIREIYPDAIENPKDFVLLKTTGAFVFHQLFVFIASKIRSKEKKFVFTKEKFREVLDLIDDRFKSSDVWKSSDLRRGIEGGLFAKLGTSKKVFGIIYKTLADSIERKWEYSEESVEPEVLV